MSLALVLTGYSPFVLFRCSLRGVCDADWWSQPLVVNLVATVGGRNRWWSIWSQPSVVNLVATVGGRNRWWSIWSQPLVVNLVAIVGGQFGRNRWWFNLATVGGPFGALAPVGRFGGSTWCSSQPLADLHGCLMMVDVCLKNPFGVAKL
jgi:hypothetical protein